MNIICKIKGHRWLYGYYRAWCLRCGVKGFMRIPEEVLYGEDILEHTENK